MAKNSVTLRWDMSKISSIENKTERGLVRMAYDIGNQARRNAPYKTGALSNSIRVVNGGDLVEVVAGGKFGGRKFGGRKFGGRNVPYAAIHEWGGYAGRNLSVRITGKHYMEKAKDAIMSGNYLQKYFGDIV